MEFTSALPVFIITLREGVEAALVIGIVLALLQKSQQSQFYPWVYGGMGCGLAASVGVGFGLTFLLQQLQASQQAGAALILPWVKVSFTALAIAMLTWMLIWMTQQARAAKRAVEGSVQSVLQSQASPGWGIGTLIFVAVFREGIETALFVAAQFQQNWGALWGAIAGLGGAAVIGWGFFALGLRINLKVFFQVMGVFLLLIVGGLVVGLGKQLDSAIALFDQSFALGNALCVNNRSLNPALSCILGPLVWDGRQVLPEQQFPGILLKTLLGYRERLFLGQVVSYILFLVGAGTLYLRSLSDRSSSTPAPKLQVPEKSP